MSKKNVSIIGLGWLGLPLYKNLSKLGYRCKGSTTSLTKQSLLKQDNIEAYLLELKETTIEGAIENCLASSEILILNTPPGLRKNPDGNYVAKIEQILPYIEKSSIKKVLFIGSTSVFKDQEHFPEITNSSEPNALTNAGSQLKEVENLLRSNKNFETTILRFAGLINDKRHPATMMSKRAYVKNPEAPVNLIHREDCIGIISAIINQNQWSKVFNASFPKHNTKQKYYNAACDRLNLNHPNFDTENPSKGKLINGEITSKALNYTYKYVV